MQTYDVIGFSRNPKKYRDVVKCAVDALKEGTLIVYPTETLYGLGADAFNEDAIKSVFAAKERPLAMPLSVAVSDTKMLSGIAEMTESAKILSQFLPGPLTLILKKKSVLPTLLSGDSETIGIRIPDNDFARAVIKKCGPITATSANLHNMKEPASVQEAIKQLDDAVAIYFDGGHCKYEQSSTVVDVSADTVGAFKIVREGVISKAAIEKALGL